MKYLFRGSVLIPNGRIERQFARVPLKGGADYPQGDLVVEIRDNEITAHFETTITLTESAIATMRNIIKDVAAGLCRCLSIIDGTWALAVVSSAEAPNGMKILFDEVAQPLKREFGKHDLKWTDVLLVTGHLEGYSLRNAIDNIILGLMEPKFSRVQFYCAVEALRTSMAPDKSEGQQWENFRSALEVTRVQIDTLRDNALRHGDYGNASSFTAAERESALSFLGQVICRYVAWFKVNKLTPSTAQAAWSRIVQGTDG